MVFALDGKEGCGVLIFEIIGYIFWELFALGNSEESVG